MTNLSHLIIKMVDFFYILFEHVCFILSGIMTYLIIHINFFRYANEPNMMKYIKISSSLRVKTVRDVALRCRWMSVSNGVCVLTN